MVCSTVLVAIKKHLPNFVYFADFWECKACHCHMSLNPQRHRCVPSAFVLMCSIFTFVCGCKGIISFNALWFKMHTITPSGKSTHILDNGIISAASTLHVCVCEYSVFEYVCHLKSLFNLLPFWVIFDSYLQLSLRRLFLHLTLKTH